MAIPFLAPLVTKAAKSIIAKKAVQKSGINIAKQTGRGVKVEINVDNSEVLEFIGQAVAFTSPQIQTQYWDRLARIEIQRVQNRLDRGVDVNNQPFKPLSASRQAQKRANKDRPLIDTGFLRRSFTSKPGPALMRIVSGAEYAEIHNEGIGVPKRQFLKYKEIELQDIAKAWAEAATGIMARDPIDPRGT